MLVTKCDICKKEIEDLYNEAVVVGLGWSATLSFCKNCGKPIVALLKKHKLLPPKTNG